MPPFQVLSTVCALCARACACCMHGTRACGKSEGRKCAPLVKVSVSKSTSKSSGTIGPQRSPAWEA
eukprot:302433-Amphidinium_carterae.1